MARHYSQKLKAYSPALKLGENELVFETTMVHTTLFIGNVIDEDEATLRTDLSQYGTVERCFILRNAHGLSKVKWDTFGGCYRPLPGTDFV
jgi:hypothetical protein